MRKEKPDLELIREYRKLCPSLTNDEIVRLICQEREIRKEVRETDVEAYTVPVKEIKAPPKRGFQKKIKANVAFDIAKAKAVSMPKVFDHLGHEFNSRAEMCSYWGINCVLFHSRHMKGWNLEDILTRPVRHRRTTKEKLASELAKWEERNHV